MSATADIADSILAARPAIVARLLATAEGRELAKLDQAYETLTGSPAPAWTVAPSKNDPPSAAAAARVDDQPIRRSVRAQVLDALESEPPRRWTYDDLRIVLSDATLGSQKDQTSALRNAMFTLVNNKQARRDIEAGEFWAARFDHILGSPNPSPDGEGSPADDPEHREAV